MQGGTIVAILDTAIVLVSLYSVVSHHFLTLSTLWKEMGIVEKEEGLPFFDSDNSKKKFYAIR